MRQQRPAVNCSGGELTLVYEWCRWQNNCWPPKLDTSGTVAKHEGAWLKPEPRLRAVTFWTNSARQGVFWPRTVTGDTNCGRQSWEAASSLAGFLNLPLCSCQRRTNPSKHTWRVRNTYTYTDIIRSIPSNFFLNLGYLFRLQFM